MKEFYYDWQFWSAVVAVLALLLSQMPPLRILFKKSKLVIDLPRTFNIDHKVGKSITYFLLTLRNTGGSSIVVKSFKLEIERENDKFELQGNSFANSNTDSSYTFLAPFILKSGERWSHMVYFEEWWTRKKNREYKRLESNIRKEIQHKLTVKPPKIGEMYEAKDEDIEALRVIFKNNYKWEAGEYMIKVIVGGEDNRVLSENKFKFILFESEAYELESYCESYKYGVGVYFTDTNKSLVTIDILENNPQ